MRLSMGRLLINIIMVTLVAIALPACYDFDEEEDDPQSEPTLVSKGIITASMNRYIESDYNSPLEHFSLMGMFVRYDSDSDHILDSLLGSSTVDVNLEIDSCTLPQPVLDETPHNYPSQETAIELLDVGNMSVSFDEARKPISTRTFPDLLKTVVGVIYTTDESKGVYFRPGEEYTLKATGSDQVGVFRVDLVAPEDLGDVTINGDLLGDQPPTIYKRERVALTWEGEGDEVIATFNWTSMVGAPWTMTCRMRDDGEFILPARNTSALPDPLTCSDEELVISRVSQISFVSEGLSSGSFRFVVSTSFPVDF